jgi:hypothetical protein
MSALLRLYPRSWRDRYGDEMQALLEAAPPGRRRRLDLVRGALDAWVRPPAPSRAPIVAALVGGGLWTFIATAVLVQPAPPDWPGYLLETLPFAIVAATCLWLATIACLLRAGEAPDRAIRLALGLLVVGYLAWIVLLVGTLVGLAGGAPLAATQTVAMLGTMAVGLILARRGDEPIGFLLLVASVALLVPSNVAWLGFGAAWTAIGIAIWIDRQRRSGLPPVAT